ncbi:helix-turn-helix domain-containing protein [Acuticoccus mangrovi]|uniref:Helix-turn-helix domain-containing protein n=1 Tax=Acuticoccus mangrovi TaxID=2796142 RepID=A0A934MCZ9_9HYPH|nr:helix-turn-helix domain-containing protein [Acuticoccus mangrovi]MBJ3775797.1 helix-turn-helix domain-containing protein [Acuticoccus mangrovi]
MDESNIAGGAITATPAFDLFAETTEIVDILHAEPIFARSALHEWHIRLHRHPRLHQFLLVLRGEAELLLERQAVPLVLPAVVNVPSGAVHGFRFAPGTDGVVLTLPAAMVAPIVEAAPVLAAAATTVAGEALVELFQAIAREHAERGALRHTCLAALATLLAARTAEALLAAGPGRAAEGAEPPLLRRFEALLEERFREHWRVATYAIALGVTPTHLTRVCREATGRSASKLVEARMMAEARRLLACTAMPVARIAEDLGYLDPAHFSRVFTRTAGMTPTAFRAYVATGSRDPTERPDRPTRS